MVLNDITVLNPLTDGGVSKEQQHPVLTRGDDRSVVGSPDSEAELGLYNDVPAVAQNEKRSTPITYTPTSDIESEGIAIQTPDTSRQPSKVLDSRPYYSTPGLSYAQAPYIDNRTCI